MAVKHASAGLNVLVILADQHQARCLGAAGHAQARTPNLDRLAAEGALCTGAYAQSPICTPSRVSLLSGQYPHNHGYFWVNGPTPQRLGSFLSHFRSAGYRTAAIGKLHVPNEPVDWLSDHVDLHAECYEYGPFGAKSPYFAYLKRLGLRDREDSFELPELPSGVPGLQPDEARPSNLPLEHAVESWIAREAIGFMRGGDAPFCMEVSFPRPHACYTPDRRFWEAFEHDLALPASFGQGCAHRPPHFQEMWQKYREYEGLLEPRGHEAAARRIWRGYLASLMQVDHCVGMLLDYLARSGLAENTVVVYTSDHGAYSGEQGMLEKIPGVCSDLVCRVPMIWRAPGVTRASSRVGSLIELVDVAPTLCGLCGVDSMAEVDGVDVTGVLAGGSDGAVAGRPALTEGPLARSVRFGRYRLVHYPAGMFASPQGELYDLEADPDETRNLYFDAAFAGVVAEGTRLLLDRLLSTTRVSTLWPSQSGPALREPGRARDWPVNLNYL